MSNAVQKFKLLRIYFNIIQWNFLCGVFFFFSFLTGFFFFFLDLDLMLCGESMLFFRAHQTVAQRHPCSAWTQPHCLLSAERWPRGPGRPCSPALGSWMGPLVLQPSECWERNAALSLLLSQGTFREQKRVLHSVLSAGIQKGKEVKKKG